jgi:membrane protease YdiL (CAAX protease family)
LALVALCALAGVAWTILYLRRPNLWVLAASHAVLGTLAYYWLLERDPWAQFFPPSP